MSILLNGVAVDELSCIVHTSKAQEIGKKLTLKLKEMIPRQMVNIAVQAAVGGKILARQDIKAYRKDVTQWLVSKIYFLIYFKIYSDVNDDLFSQLFFKYLTVFSMVVM